MNDHKNKRTWLGHECCLLTKVFGHLQTALRTMVVSGAVVVDVGEALDPICAGKVTNPHEHAK